MSDALSHPSLNGQAYMIRPLANRTNRFPLLFSFLLTALLASSCGTPQQITSQAEAHLIAEFRKWEGAPYQLGGETRRGVDCSSFVRIVMSDVYGIAIPGTTREQMQVGRRVSPGSARLGDLVFFQTGPTTYHVGILMRDDFFMHASTSRGVTIDRLREPYWQQRIIQIRRLPGRS